MSTNPVGAFIVFTFPKHFETFLPSIVKFENFKLKLKFYSDYNWFFFYPHIYQQVSHTTWKHTYVFKTKLRYPNAQNTVWSAVNIRKLQFSKNIKMFIFFLKPSPQNIVSYETLKICHFPLTTSILLNMVYLTMYNVNA